MVDLPTYRTAQYDFDAALAAIESIQADDLPKRLTCPEYAEFEATEYERRYARLAALMAADDIDGALLTQKENVRYFTGYLSVLWISNFRPLVGVVPTDPDKDAAVIVSGQERANADITSWVDRRLAFPPQESPIEYIADALRDAGLGRARIGLELGFGQRLGMNQQQFHELQVALPDVEFVDVTPLTQAVRMLKSAPEVERIARACAISCAGVRAGWESLREGVSERELLSTMASEMFRAGAEVGTKPAFFGIQAGERWWLSNAVASDYRVKRGDMVLVDGGATFRGYTCDFIRQASLGPLSSAQQEWFELMVEANAATRAAIRAGVKASEVYGASLRFLDDHGVGKFNRMNIVGHGVGADVHELPWVGESEVVYTADTQLRAGMVLAIEPGITVASAADGPEGHFIVEEILEVTDSGSRVLTGDLSPQLWVADVN